MLWHSIIVNITQLCVTIKATIQRETEGDKHRDRERERQTERVDNNIRVVKVVFMPGALAPWYQPMGCVCLWGAANHVQLVMANVSEHLTGNEQDSLSVYASVLVHSQSLPSGLGCFLAKPSFCTYTYTHGQLDHLYGINVTVRSTGYCTITLTQDCTQSTAGRQGTHTHPQHRHRGFSRWAMLLGCR